MTAPNTEPGAPLQQFYEICARVRLSRRDMVCFDTAVAAESMMARRRIGQERLGVVRETTHGGASLDQMSALIDWIAIDQHLAESTLQQRANQLGYR
jgi:hypothetical protein